MPPLVVVHTAVSADGRVDRFQPHVGLFYRLAGRWDEDATLTGADTILEAEAAAPAEGLEPYEGRQKDPDDTRPLLAVVDTKGRVRIWGHLRDQQYWRGVVALVSAETPAEYLDYLGTRGVECFVSGDEHVDLGECLEWLEEQHGVRTVRVDSGGTLSGALLRAGLVDEVSVLVHPVLVGGTSPMSFYRAPDLSSSEGVIPLRLLDVERHDSDVVWLRYEVVR